MRSKSYELKLYEDSQWKESGLSKLEILLDDSRNQCGDFSDIGDFLEYGNTYRLTITITRLSSLSTAAADSQNGPLRVGAVQIGICGGDDPKTLPRLNPCPRCGYCGFIEDSEMNLASVCPECNGKGHA
jgi:hypothetical protein